MGPRPRGRGIGRKIRLEDATGRSFNGAATARSRNRRSVRKLQWIWSRFNGAATARSRNHDGHDFPFAIDFGFNGAATARSRNPLKSARRSG